MTRRRKKGDGRGAPTTAKQNRSWIKRWWGLVVGGVGVLLLLLTQVQSSIEVIEKLLGRFGEPRLILQSVDSFAIEAEEGVFEIGLIAKLANLDDKPDVLEQVTFDGASLDIAARGATYIQEVHRPIAFGEVVESHVLHAGDATYVKLLLPLRIHMTNQPPLPEFLVWGRWTLKVKGGLLRRGVAVVTPEHVGCLETPISQRDWNRLSGAAIEEAYPLKRRRLSSRFDSSAPVGSLLLFNADRSARFDLYGFDQTNPAVGQAGTMVWIRGLGTPEIPSGWTVLGTSYPEVWADKDRLRIYNTVYPPDSSGRPRPFAAFAGAEREMGVTESVPVTRGRDIMSVRLLSRSEFDAGPPVYFRFGTAGVLTVRQ